MKFLMKNWQLALIMISSPVLLIGCVPMVGLGVGAGAGATGVAMSEDRRTSGTFIEDEGIELKSTRRLNEQLGSKAHINVTSFNRNVLLTGEVPDRASKELAEKLVMSIENVQDIANELAVGGISSLASRSNDALLTTKVKGRLLTAETVQINHVKVITENSVVYLLGVVKRIEANSAASVASSTAGVSKVIKVFEYLD